ncbi:CocE/NonD family hydrolase [Fibrella sp. HMF5335]|uniref:CocE/NonD family hydrolase n=1 Tax=Fibrella rubiginis TaxID=2817060 RepID=A0A939GM98_9BACT|nr:CocE/NonD family hydrolase [Fibrella rubiginis]MBO0939974.1 CocE/NonD family hydrolase [Fibrella rubiginis]
MTLRALLLLFSTALSLPLLAQTPADSAFVRANYIKLDRQITMRDGVKLYTLIYVPKDASTNRSGGPRYPFLMERTPYSAGPYGETKYPKRGPGPSSELSQEKYIFVFQDVRGRYMSEGNFEEMTPHVSGVNGSMEELKRKYTKRSGYFPDTTTRTQRNLKNLSPVGPVDESTDTYDTIEWLLKNIPNNNGRVGIMGISYPGFYASAALPNAHPAIKAVSPQAPVTDEFAGDDARHNGAFFLLDNFSFMNYFDAPRTGPVTDYPELFTVDAADMYQFLLNLGPIKNANGPAYFNNKGKIWNEYLAHDTYDGYWKARNIRPHLNMVRPGSTPPATLVVGGWYDAEDLFGALNTYATLEKRAGNQNQLVMGPWTHGAWAGRDFSKFGDFQFGQNTAKSYRDSVETPFFNFYLKDKGHHNTAEARVFDTGTNQWRTFAQWPPQNVTEQAMYLSANGQLTNTPPSAPTRYEYVSDPAKPVPYTDGTWSRRNNAYMIEDQRFAARRPDVLVFQTEPLSADMTLAGPISVDLRVAVSSTDADFIVKLIDVLPDTASSPKPVIAGAKPVTMAGYQRLVRADVMRGKFRNSLEKPEAFVPGQPTTVAFTLNDALHTFRKGHRLMIQVQSSWFPLVDRNPQTFMNISEANEADFNKAIITLFADPGNPSAIRLRMLR